MKTNDNHVKNFLKRAKLLMEYDLKKTSDENIQKLNEQGEHDKEFRCKKILAVPGALLFGSKVGSAEVKIGLSNSEFEEAQTQGLFKSNFWDTGDFSEVQKINDDELVNALDTNFFVYGSGGFDKAAIDDIINRVRKKYFFDEDTSMYYPFVEGLRYDYIEDEGGDTIKGDLQEWVGQKAAGAQNAIVDFTAMYDIWIKDVLQPFFCGTNKPVVSPTTPPTVTPTPIPVPGDEPWKKCCVFSSTRYRGAEYRKDTDDILIPVEYGFMLLKEGGQGWGVQGTLTVYDADGNEFNKGNWSCGGGEFRFFIKE